MQRSHFWGDTEHLFSDSTLVWAIRLMTSCFVSLLLVLQSRVQYAQGYLVMRGLDGVAERVSFGLALLAVMAPSTVLADCGPDALLAESPLAIVLADSITAALLAPSAHTTVLADSLPTALLA